MGLVILSISKCLMINKFITTTRLGMAWLLVFLFGCSPATVTIDREYKSNLYTDENRPIIDSCDFFVYSLEDDRRDKGSLGEVAYTEVFSEDVLQWVQAGFESFDIDVQTYDGQYAQAIPIKVHLKLAHINSLLSAKAANVVLGVSLNDDANIEYFRGSHSSINWSSSASEIKGAFDISLGEAITGLLEYMKFRCAS